MSSNLTHAVRISRVAPMRMIPRYVLPLLAGFAVTRGAAAQVIDYTEVRQYVGEDVIVQGPVVRVERGTGGILRFSIGKTYSRRTLEVIVPAEFVNSLDPNIHSYEGKTVQVRGRIVTGGADAVLGVRENSPSSVPMIVLQDSGKLKVVSTPAPEEKTAA